MHFSLIKSVTHFGNGELMNFRQYKKKVFHKRKKHGYWKEYKKKLRKFFAEHPCRISGSEYPKRKRIRQLKKIS